MKRRDILAAFIIGEVCALIFLWVSRFLELPAFIIRLARFFPLVLPVLSISGTYVVSLFEKRKLAIFQFGKSFLVGILNTFIDLGVLNLLMWAFNITSGVSYSIFKGVSVFIATVNSYFWNKFWAFEKKETEKAGTEFLQFFLIAGIGFLINLGVASLLVNVIGPQFGLSDKIWANIGALVAVFFGFSWNFFGYKFVVFKK